jgi:hypothetical protein
MPCQQSGSFEQIPRCGTARGFLRIAVDTVAREPLGHVFEAVEGACPYTEEGRRLAPRPHLRFGFRLDAEKLRKGIRRQYTFRGQECLENRKRPIDTAGYAA